jgi:hypothetical protein
MPVQLDIALPASLNVTLPVGVPPPEDETLAVNVTELPTVDGLALEARDVVVVYELTVCVNAVEVLLA